MGSNFVRQPWVIILLIVLVILLFGANKLPGLARNMGQSMRIFKSEVSEMRKEGDKKEEAQPAEREYDPRPEAAPAPAPKPAVEDDPYRRD